MKEQSAGENQKFLFGASCPNLLYPISGQNQAGDSLPEVRCFCAVIPAVWNFMKKTPFFKEYYDEIKLYFLHTYLYETLYFAKLRDFKPSYAFYKELEKTVLAEVPDYAQSIYSALIPKQMELYRMIGEGMTEVKFKEYWEQL